MSSLLNKNTKLSFLLCFLWLINIYCLDIQKDIYLNDRNISVLQVNPFANPSDYITETMKVKRLNKSKLSNSLKSQSLHRRGDLIESDQNDIIKIKAVLNNTALLTCRPDKKLLTENGIDENTKGTLLWKRTKTNEYLIHNNRRLHPDTRYILDMSSFDQTILDLRIDHVQRTDEGEYVCLYSNGQTVYKQRVYLNVLVPPVISENSSSPTRVIAHEGEAVILQCKAWGVPEPIITWYLTPKEGRQYRIYEATDKRFVIKPNQLIISNITRDLQGTYKCLAQNGLKENTWRVIELDVRYPPTIEMANLKLGQLLKGTTMVRAVIAGNPINLFYWEFEGRPIHGPNSNCLVPMPNEKYCILVDKANSKHGIIRTTLFIANLTMANYGHYTCVVETPFGTFRNSTEIFRTYSSPSTTWDNSFGGNYDHHFPNLLTNYQGSYEKMSEKLNKRATYLTQDRLKPSSYSSLSSVTGQNDFNSISTTNTVNQRQPPICPTCLKYKNVKDLTTLSPDPMTLNTFSDYNYLRNLSNTLKLSLSTFHLIWLHIFTSFLHYCFV
uniref:Septate junction protein n=1 Tax=Schistosoma mansoni TaxID=6183 RepID=A0A3Q0KP02_SCHMA